MYEMPWKVLKIRGIFIVDFLLLFKLFILLKNLKLLKKLLTNALWFAIIIFALERAANVSKETKK